MSSKNKAGKNTGTDGETVPLKRAERGAAIEIVLTEPRRLGADVWPAGTVLFVGHANGGLTEREINKALCGNAARARAKE